MPSPKEKPKKAKSKGEGRKPSARSQPAISPRQAAKLMKDKYVQQLDQRQSETGSAEVQAVDQVEDAGRWAVDELLIRERPRSLRQKERDIKEKPQEVRGRAEQPPPSPEPEPEVRSPIPQERAVRAHEQELQKPKVRDTAVVHERPAPTPQGPTAAPHASAACPSQEQAVTPAPPAFPPQEPPAPSPAPSALAPQRTAAGPRSRPAPKERTVRISRERPSQVERRPPVQTVDKALPQQPERIRQRQEVIPKQAGQPSASTEPPAPPARGLTPTQKALRIKERPTARIKETQTPAPTIKERGYSSADPSIVSIQSIESIPSSEEPSAAHAESRPQSGAVNVPERKAPTIRRREEQITKLSVRTEGRTADTPLPSSGAAQFKREAHQQSVTRSRQRLPRHPSMNAAPQKAASITPAPRNLGGRSLQPVRSRANVKNSVPKIRGVVYRKGVSSPKTARIPVKSAVTRPVRNIRQNLQQRMTRQAVQQAGKAARTSAAVFRKAAVAVTKAAAAIVNALAAIAGGGILLIAMVVIIVIAAVANSPFGLFFAQEPNAPDTVSVAQAVGTVNAAYNARLELLQSGDYDSITVQGQAPDWAEVLAVFAVHTAGVDAGGVDVATLDPDRVARLTAVFWDMTGISVEEETIEHADSDPDDDVDDSWTEKILHITVTPQTADDMRVSYAFTDYQNSALDELLSDRAALSSLAGSLTITGADEREVLSALPVDLEQARRDTVQTALQLVGKVNYFWGGKSSAIGWDSRWGTLQKVTAAGSPSTGTYRPFGLDCSGMIDWVLRNCGLHSDGNWYIGTNLTAVSQANALPGDFALYPDASHIGIVVGRNEAGKLLVCHCSSGRNNVVVTEFSASGFTVVGRPDIFGP